MLAGEELKDLLADAGSEDVVTTRLDVLTEAELWDPLGGACSVDIVAERFVVLAARFALIVEAVAETLAVLEVTAVGLLDASSSATLKLRLKFYEFRETVLTINLSVDVSDHFDVESRRG